MITLEVIKGLFKIVLFVFFAWICFALMYSISPTFTIVLLIVAVSGMSYEGWLWYKRRQENRRWGIRG